MTARQLAEQDIKEDLQKNNKCFIAFHKELNPVMRTLVRQQLKEQINLSPFHPTSHPKTNSQLIARCSFAKGGLCYENYEKYYKPSNK